MLFSSIHFSCFFIKFVFILSDARMHALHMFTVVLVGSVFDGKKSKRPFLCHLIK